MIEFQDERRRMVEEQLRARGLNDERLLAAFRHTPRHLFVPEEFRPDAYADRPLPIGSAQTISQPYMVALMIERLRLKGHERVLEIGGGSGYQTAILSQLALEVFSVERLPELLGHARERLAALGCLNVHFTPGNGSLGWSEHAPYDAIIVSAAAPSVPQPLIDQLSDHGRMVLPIGPPEAQMLVEVEKRRGAVSEKPVASCVFVPLVGEYGWPQNQEQ